MTKNVVIVESPAKARTLARFLGSDYKVVSSFGHVRDLPKKGLGVDIARDFEPTYEISPDKKKVVAELKREAKGNEVWLASDEDREGEAIAWHISILLGLDPTQTKRIVFHEITKEAITQAVAKPRQLDQKLVDAQQARRILDRLVGYELSPILWRKVRPGLSAGRVQSVAVRLIVEREREIRNFEPQTSYKVGAVFRAGQAELPAELTDKIDVAKNARELLDALKTADFTVGSIEQRPGTRSPAPPFTTSTLQQESSRKLGYGVRQTMTLAQRLYENGHITYMRTDSTVLSAFALKATKQYISKQLGEKYFKQRQYQTTSASAQEAHEAIRPTNFNTLEVGNDTQQKKLYQLIWQRALASQMAAASIQKTNVSIDISNRKEQFTATGEVLTFDGWLRVYGGGKEDKILPALKQGEVLNLISAEANVNFSRAPARYSEASLVRKLEELGIGRPSTYAPTIGTIQDRGYIEKADAPGEIKQTKKLLLKEGEVSEHVEPVTVGADRNKLMPTHVAEVVTDFLTKYFASVIDYDFTAKAEEEFDSIAIGKRHWREAIKDFYARFHPLVEVSAQASRAEAAQARTLGTDPKSGKPVVVRYGRYGPVLQLGSTDEEADTAEPRFAPLPAGARLDDVTLEQALPMFELPRVVGKTKQGEEITASIGRFGPYIKVNKTFVSLKEQDPLEINEVQARELLASHQKVQAEKTIADFGNIKILRGPYGPYITDGKRNARIPKTVEPEKMSQEDATALLAKAPARKKFPRRAKK